jgi:two-component sensor histidine kinase
MIFKAPKSKHEYLFGRSMFETIWNIFLFLTIFFLAMSIKHLIAGNPNSFTFIGALVMSVMSLMILKITGRYHLPGIFGSVFGSVFCLYSVIFVADHSAISDILWVVLVSLFAFYSLGSIWGMLILIANITAIAWRYIPFVDDQEYVMMGNVSEENTILNVIVVSISISYLIHRITQASVFANRDFEKANKKLQKQNEIVIAQSNEKTVLLQEIHHRVKNNLQVISSLIRLQSRETEDTKAKMLFETSVNRIQAMALIHEKMYQGENLSKINLEEYLDGLAKDIFRSYFDDTKINFTIKSELEIIGNRAIVPLALIFNELITNSMKHAFDDFEEGNISIEIKLSDNDYFTLDYFDSGRWKKATKVSSFGLELIETFTEQLDGTLERISDDNGTLFKFKLLNID